MKVATSDIDGRLESATTSSPLRLAGSAAEAILVWLAITFIVVLGRLDTFELWQALNSDEAQAGANVLRLLRDPMPWRSVDGGSNGPGNFLVLMIPYLFGQPISLYWERLIGVGLFGATLACLYLLAVRFVSRPMAVILLAFPTLFYATTTHAHLLHYHSEIVPVLLIAIATLLALRLNERYTLSGAFVLLNVAVAIPFAKIQGAVLSVLFQAFALWHLYRAIRRRPPGRRLLAFVGRAVVLYLPLLLSLAVLAATGAWSALMGDYFQSAAGYVLPMLGLRNLYWLGFSAGLSYRGLVFFSLLLVAAGALWTAWATWRMRRATDGRAGFLLGTAVVLGAVSVWTILRPGRPFEHYLYFTIVPLFLLTVAAFAFVRRERNGNAASRIVPVVLCGVVLLAYADYIEASKLGRKLEEVATGSLWKRLHDGLFPRGEAWASWILPPGGSMFVWGWEADWYIYASAHPVTRSTVAGGHFDSVAMGRRLASELEHEKPLVIVDAVAPANIRYKDPKVDGIDVYAPLKDKLRGYVLVNPKGFAIGCPRMYVDGRHLAESAGRFVAINRAALERPPGERPDDGNLQRLFDYSTFERCGDYWSVPKSANPTIVLDIDESPIRRIAILNSFGPRTDEPTESLHLSLWFKDKQVYERDVPLAAYPRWTPIELASAVQADQVRLSNLRGAGENVSLNEVLIER